MKAALTFTQAWSRALELLSWRAYSEAELAERLARKGALPEVVEEVLDRLREYRLVDDEWLARNYVESRSARKGPLALRAELRRKGLAEKLVERTVETVDEATQLEAARGLLSKRRWRYSGGDARRQRARAFAFLARRGFTADVAAQAVDEAGWIGAEDGLDDGELEAASDGDDGSFR